MGGKDADAVELAVVAALDCVGQHASSSRLALIDGRLPGGGSWVRGGQRVMAFSHPTRRFNSEAFLWPET